MVLDLFLIVNRFFLLFYFLLIITDAWESAFELFKNFTTYAFSLLKKNKIKETRKSYHLVL